MKDSFGSKAAILIFVTLAKLLFHQTMRNLSPCKFHPQLVPTPTPSSLWTSLHSHWDKCIKPLIHKEFSMAA